jgi:hypothetical protein
MTKKQFKTQAKSYIQNQIATNMAWTTKALLTVFANQTADEQRAETTNLHNRKGFTSTDAKFMCNVAKKVNRFALTERQLFTVRKKLMKYWKQVFNVCDHAKLALQMASATPESFRPVTLATPRPKRVYHDQDDNDDNSDYDNGYSYREQCNADRSDYVNERLRNGSIDETQAAEMRMGA